MSLDKALSKLKRRESLDAAEMAEAMEMIVSGRANDGEIESFLVLLREKGETSVEIASAAGVMRRHAVKLPGEFGDLLDTCGTGGDGLGTVNISTLAAIVAAAAGARVAKHGNRSVSSVCGSADLLEGLGVRIDLTPEKLAGALRETNFAFLFAPQFHPAVRFAMPARKKIKTKTLFNILGPLSNPAGARHQVLGVYDKKLVRVLAEALLSLGTSRALVVHGADGSDEISIAGETHVADLRDGKIREYALTPEALGVERSSAQRLQCPDKPACIAKAREILEGVPGPAADAVAVNAGAALFVCGKAAALREGVSRAAMLLKDGSAKRKLDQIVEFSKCS